MKLNANATNENIRRKAELILKNMPDDLRPEVTLNVDALIQELQVYQVELELQNEELRQAQDQLSLNLNLYTNLFNSIPVGAVIVNKNGTILKANDFFCKLLCLSNQDVEGKSLVSFIADDDQHAFYSRFSSFFKSPNDKLLTLKLYCRSEHTYRDVEISGQKMSGDLQLNNLLFNKKFGDGPFRLLTLIDKTRQNKMRAELQKSELRELEQRKKLETQMLLFEQVSSQISMGMMITDVNGTIVFTNPALSVITGYSADEMLGKPADMFKSDKASDYSAMWKDVREGKSWQGTFLNKRKDGTEYWEAARIDCVYDSNGVITHFASVKEDITQKIEQENELRSMNFKLEAAKAKSHELAIKAQEANVAKSVFLANMSHEIRTPLNAILGFSELIDRLTSTDGTVKDYNSRIIRSGEHLLSLLNNILELSRIEAGKTELQEAELSIEGLLGDVMSMYSVSARQKGLELIFQTDPGIPDNIIADGHKLRRVLFNLVSNALKFTRQGSVTVSVMLKTNDKGARYLYFTVQDTGGGIEKNELGKLFQRFAQTSSGMNQQSGSGLGLALVYEMVHLMGGDVEVKSEIGVGSTFMFSIPYLQGYSESDKAVKQRRIKGLNVENWKKYRILVADDSEINRLFTVEMLNNAGFETVEATTGEEVLQMVHSKNPDLCLIDLHMSGYNGLEMIHKLNVGAKGNQVKVIAMTANAAEVVGEPLTKAGFNGFIIKPFRIDELLEIIGGLLELTYEYEDKNHNYVHDTVTYNWVQLREWVEKTDPNLKVRMLTALRKGDLEAFGRYIEEIDAEAKELKLYLIEQISNFNYDTLFRLMEPTTEFEKL